jgi:hypothetical protein
MGGPVCAPIILKVGDASQGAPEAGEQRRPAFGHGNTKCWRVLGSGADIELSAPADGLAGMWRLAPS